MGLLVTYAPSPPFSAPASHFFSLTISAHSAAVIDRVSVVTSFVFISPKNDICVVSMDLDLVH